MHKFQFLALHQPPLSFVLRYYHKQSKMTARKRNISLLKILMLVDA